MLQLALLVWRRLGKFHLFLLLLVSRRLSIEISQ